MSGVDTIYALSSGGMPSGVAVVRISGGAVAAVAEIVCGGLPAARYASLRPIRSRNGELLDEGLVIYFPGPASFTGEDVLEIHLHGSRAVAAAVLSELAGFTGLRMAEAGEFSRRAYLNGKKDLAAVEGLADLIAAETEAQRRFAQGNSSGVQSRLYQSWRQRIIDMRSLIEAELDFADEGDIAGSVSDLVWGDAARLGEEIRGHLAGFKRAEIVLDGFKVVLAGAPNAGKSSLLNALAKRDAAIVSDEPGTTRDLVDVSLDLGGMKVVLTDTAGIR
ncbi:MAG: tRNA uridine-5-carboxymethylaminomethyl(34) synthesis GTPase MnmE, partial [Rhizobiaceae bacterium]